MRQCRTKSTSVNDSAHNTVRAFARIPFRFPRVNENILPTGHDQRGSQRNESTVTKRSTRFGEQFFPIVASTELGRGSLVHARTILHNRSARK